MESSHLEFAKNMRIAKHTQQISTTDRPAIQDPAAYGFTCEKHVKQMDAACLGDGASVQACESAGTLISACYQRENDAIETATINGGAGVTKLGTGFGKGITIGGSNLNEITRGATSDDKKYDRTKIWS